MVNKELSQLETQIKRLLQNAKFLSAFETYIKLLYEYTHIVYTTVILDKIR